MQLLAAAWALAEKDLRSFLRDRTALVLSLLVPIALVSVFGWIMAYAFGGSSGMPRVSLHVADLAGSTRSKSLVEALGNAEMIRLRPIDTASPNVAGRRGAGGGTEAATAELSYFEDMIRDGDAHHVLVIPVDYDEQLESSEIPRLVMFRDPGRAMEDRVVQLAVMQASMSEFGGSVFTEAMDRVLTEQGMETRSIQSIRGWMTEIGETIGTFYEEQEQGSGAEATAASNPASETMAEREDGAEPTSGSPPNESRSPQNEVSSAGGREDVATSMFDFMEEVVPLETKDIAPPSRGKQVTYQQAQSVAGMTVMMLLFALTSCGSVLLTEREEGTLKRLFAQPMSRNAVLLGKFMFVMIVGLGQMAILFTYGEWMFRVGLFRDPLTLFVLSISWVLAGGAFGMFLASVSRSTKQAESLASLLILVMAALGGCWFPLQMMNLPPLFEAICKSTMTYWAMTGFQNMLWNQLTWLDSKVLTALCWQWGWALVFLIGSAYFFRRNFCRG